IAAGNEDEVEKTTGMLDELDTIKSAAQKTPASSPATSVIQHASLSMKDVLLATLIKIESAHDIHEIMMTSRSFLQDPIAPGEAPSKEQTRTSKLGKFVRQMILDYQQMDFHCSRIFYEGFVRFRTDIIKSTSGKAGNDDASLLTKRSGGDLESSSGTSPKRAKLDFVTAMTSEIDAETYLDNLALGFGIAKPQEGDYFNVFLNAKRIGEMDSAESHLRRFYDYSLDEQHLYQYALLDLAILHKCFGQFPEALNAAQECVKISRQFEDHKCLAFAIEIRDQLAKQVARSSLSKQHHLHQSKDVEPFSSYARKLGLTNLEISHRLHTASSSRNYGDPPSDIFAELERVLALQHQNRVYDKKETIRAELADTWAHYGVPLISNAVLDAKKESDLDSRQLCTKAYMEQAQGNYAAADAILSNLIGCTPFNEIVKMQQVVLCETRILLERALNRNELKKAAGLLSKLSALTSDNTDLFLNTRLQYARYLIKCGDRDLAFGCLRSAIDEASNFDAQHPLRLIELLLELAQFYL
ncbi:anaphase promoting complex subunit 5, partial [Chytridiales sp. JEL 0842]